MVNYVTVLDVIQKPSKERKQYELLQLAPFFRSKSNLFTKITDESLLDVIQHCEFVTRKKDDVIILQGERGHRFFIILRGSVSVMLSDAPDDLDLGEEVLEPRNIERATLGNAIVSLGEGTAFGELALIHPDCVRTASIIADEKTDLIVIHQDLYKRSVSKVVERDYSEKANFIDSIPFLKVWPQRLKRQLTVCFRKVVHNFDATLVKQGEDVRDIHFIVSGEVKLVVNPEGHFDQYERFMSKYDDLMEKEGSPIDENDNSGYYPPRLLPRLQKFKRVNKANILNHSQPNLSVSLPSTWSPSAIRKMNSQIKSNPVNLCYLGERQMIGDIELLVGFPVHHASAICSRETTIMSLHRNHFERLFRKRNPNAIKDMMQNLETQLMVRCMKHNILESVPLMRCLLFKLQESKGTRKPEDQKAFVNSLRSIAENEKFPVIHGRSTQRMQLREIGLAKSFNTELPKIDA